MIYITEDKVVFRTDDGALWNKERYDEKIILTPIVARLLHLFFQEQGKVLTRETILNRVWEDYGLEPSNNSLNQYVSQIRKIMTESGLPDDIICTIPRVGFTFSSEIVVVREDISDTKLHSACENRVNAFSKKVHTISIYYAVIFMVIFISIPFLTEYATDNIHHQEMAVSPTPIGQTGSCTIYSLLMGRKRAPLRNAVSGAGLYKGEWYFL